MSDEACTSAEREEELKSFLQHLLEVPFFISASVLATFVCPQHGDHVTSFVASQNVPNSKDHVRKLIDHIRAYADALEKHYFSETPATPVHRRHDAGN